MNKVLININSKEADITLFSVLKMINRILVKKKFGKFYSELKLILIYQSNLKYH